MNALFAIKRQLHLRRKAKRVPMSASTKRSLDTHLLNWMWLYGLIGFACLYGIEYLSHSAEPVRLQMITVLETSK